MGEVERGSHSEADYGKVGDFADVFRREFPRLAGYCSGLVGDREVGADLAQEALARTWARWAHVAEPRAYSYLVATNLARRHWKSSSREAQVRSALSTRSLNIAPADGVVRDLVERLPERLRVATVLHYYADLPVEQVARLLHRPLGTIRQRLYEARRLLVVALERED